MPRRLMTRRPLDLRHQTVWQKERCKLWRDRSDASRTVLSNRARFGVTVASNHNTFAWLVEFVGTLVNKNEVEQDGKAPCGRLERGNLLGCSGLNCGRG